MHLAVSKAPLFLSLGAAALVGLLYYSGFIDSLEEKAVRPLEFKLRSTLHRAPTLDPRLKIYAYDDATLRFVKKPDLEFTLWLKLFAGIEAQNPRVIMVDKIFSVIDHEGPLSMPPSAVATAVYAVPGTIPFRDPLPAGFKDFDLGNWIGHDATATDLSWLKLNSGYVYGPDPTLLGGFQRFGHILYANNGWVRLFHRFDPTHAVPHWSLLAAEQLSLDERGIRVNEQRLATINGQVAVNMLDTDLLHRNMYGMTSLIHKTREGRSLEENIQPGQIVVILPSMFTGSTDMVETPIGSVPGSYVVLSMLNSVLSGQWIRTLEGGLWVILLFTIAGWALTRHFHVVWTPLMVGTMLLAIVGSGLFFFVYGSMQTPWFTAVLAFGTTALTHLMWIAIYRIQEAQRITQAVAGLVPHEHLNSLLKDRRDLEFEPTGHVVSIMFVDIVGFSLTTKKLSANETFLQLKALLGAITEIIHAHQGTIDKTLGDGLLCFFGYNVLGQHSNNHADLAVRCGIAIQKHVFQNSLKAYAEGKALYPLRIGINTASVFIGNIGNHQRFDFTMIGDGVNFAARLETACAPFKIMIGPATKSQLLDFSPDHPSMLKRLVMVKHTSDLLEAWEVDPFYNTGEDVSRMERLYWSYAGIFQREDRHPVRDERLLRLNTSLGQFQLKNYSLSGMGLHSNVFLAQGVVFNLSLESTDEAINRELHQWGLSSLIVEICWGSQRHDTFEHGVRFVGLSSEQKTRIFELLHQRLSVPLQKTPGF